MLEILSCTFNIKSGPCSSYTLHDLHPLPISDFGLQYMIFGDIWTKKKENTFSKSIMDANVQEFNISDSRKA